MSDVSTVFRARVADERAEPLDAELVARACADDARAFELLVRRHYRTAFAVALAVMGNRADAEDVCHDAFVRAATRLESCRERDRFAQWLATIVRNHARNALARDPSRRATSIELLDADDAPQAASRDDASRRVEIAELGERLECALATLSPVQREVLLLHDLDGWDHRDIAQAIGTSPGMSRQHLFNARRRMRAALGDQR